MPIKTNQLKKDEPVKKSGGSRSAKKKVKKKKSTAKSKGLFSFLKNEKFQRITGFFFILLSFYLLLSFISFMINWYIGG
ncbi:MAG: hypothetical protein ABFS05_06575, partial [Bacteroidota bacterium]